MKITRYNQIFKREIGEIKYPFFMARILFTTQVPCYKI